MDIKESLQAKYIDEPTERFTREFISDLMESYPELNENLFEIRKRSHRHVTHAVYDNKFKLVSIKNLVKLFKHYYDLLNHDNIQREAIYVSDDMIKDCWVKCVSSSLFPNVVEDRPGWYKVDYLSESEYRELKHYDLLNITKNSEKFLMYANLVKDMPVCITDFNLSNFVINRETNEIFMVDVCDIDYVSYFRPEVFFTSSEPNKLQKFLKSVKLKRDGYLRLSRYNFYICKKLLDQENNSLESYYDLLIKYLGSEKEIESIKFF